MLKVLLLFTSLCTLVAWCGKEKVRREALFLHTYIATKGELCVDTRDGSKYLKDQLTFDAANLPPLERFISDTALAYLCKCAFQIRTALHNTGKFSHYLNMVKDVWQLKVFVNKKKNMDSLDNENVKNLVLFLQDALLLLSVTEQVTTLSSEERCDILTQILSISAVYAVVNFSQVLPSLSFINFANFMETMPKPLPIKYSPQYKLMGRINADRFVRLLDTYKRGTYDLSDVLNFLSSDVLNFFYSDKIPPKFVRELNLDNSVKFYLDNRLEEVSLIRQLTYGRHGFGYFFRAPAGSDGCSTLLALEQVTYQMNYLFHATQPAPLLKESILVGFARFRGSALAEYVRDWLDIWKLSFSSGFTEVVDFQVASNNLDAVYEKLLVLKIYFKSHAKRMAQVLELEKKFEDLVATFQLH